MTPHRESPIARHPLRTRVFRSGLLAVGLTSAALLLGATGCGSDDADGDGSGGTSSGGGDASGGKNGSGGGDASGGDEGTGGSSSGGSSTGGSSSGGQSGLGGGGGDGGAGALVCPEIPPTGGAVCAADGMCSYRDCDTFGQVVATCADGEWSVDSDACSTFACSTGGESCQADEVCLSTGTVIVRTCEPNTCGDSPVSCDCLDSCDGDCPVTGSPEGGIFVDCTD
jgi:hypothetical protein